MFKVVAISAAAFVGLASALTVNTPAALVQCQPALLSWSDGTAPYYVAIIPGGQPSAAALESLPTQQGTTFTWTVDIASGTSITVKVTDSTGAINYSDQVTIQAGTSTSCSNSGSGASAAPAGSSSSSAGGVATAAVISSSASKAASMTPSSSASSSSAPSSSSASSSVKMTTSVTSGVGAAAGATTTSSSSASALSTASTKNGAASIKAATGLLLGGLVVALAA